ncbi:MAG: LytR/AlgR family response regulator transcription factor [Bacteroidales bacterium]
MPIKILIIEDELPAQRLLARFVCEIIPGAQIQSMLASVKESIDWLQSNTHPDIIFMDVQLSDGLCFNILEQIKPDSFIIFTTAYDQYAIQAFKANTIDYLLKPIKKEQIQAAIEKVNEQSKLYQKLHIQEFDVQKLMEVIQQSRQHYRERFLVGAADGWYKLDVCDIAFFYLENKSTVAVDFTEKSHVLNQNLNQIMESLDPKQFFRTNRQTIVNINAIQKVEPWFHGKLLVKTRPRHQEKIIVVREKATLFRDLWLNG